MLLKNREEIQKNDPKLIFSDWQVQKVIRTKSPYTFFFNMPGFDEALFKNILRYDVTSSSLGSHEKYSYHYIKDNKYTTFPIGEKFNQNGVQVIYPHLLDPSKFDLRVPKNTIQILAVRNDKDFYNNKF